MFLTNSDQETIQTISFDLFTISNAFKKLNQKQHDLTHIVLKITKFC